MSDPLLYEQDGAVVTLTLNMPEKHNPISEKPMIEALVGALDRVNQDKSVRCVILTANGKSFSSGGDMKAMQAELEARSANPARTPAYYVYGIQKLPLAFTKCEVPIICAVNGAAVGAGNDLTTMCDIRIAGESARFAESFVKVGLVAGDGGAWLLPRTVGFSKACEMAFTGEMIDAQEALRIGLVSKVVPDAELLDTARAMARKIAANPGPSLRMTRKLLQHGREMGLASSLEMAAQMQALAHTTADHAEAVNAFLEKRKPVFTN